MKAATEYAVLAGGAGTAITALLCSEPVRMALASIEKVADLMATI